MLLLWALSVAQYDPRLVFSTVETAHLRVHYHQGYYEFACEVAKVGEASLVEIQKLLGHEMPDKIEVVLSDDTDDANGSANVVPYPIVRGYVTPPDDLSFLAEHQYWAYELIAHELTHVVHLDTVHNVSKLINTIFGRTWIPNQLQSRWFIEGLAVEVESKISYGGRARARMVDMVLRAEAVDDNSIRLDQAVNGPYRWPQGNTWYLHGGRFLSYVAERYGHDKLRAISNRYGGTLIPYAMNRAFKAEIGRDYDEVWADFQADLLKGYAEQLARVQARGLVQGKQLTSSGQRNYNPRYFPDGRLMYFAEGYSLIPQIRTVEDGELTKINTQGQAARPDPQGRIVFSQQDIVRNFYPFQDLWEYDSAHDRMTRLTENQRARDPDVSHGYVYFVQNRGTKQRLQRAPLIDGDRRKLGEAETLWDPGPPYQMYTPRVSPDGRFVALSVFRPPGQRDIAVFDVETHEVTWLTDDISLDGGPTWTPDGARVFFHSARSDIYNIYAYALADKSLTQITNVMTGAFSPDISPDGRRMAYLGYSSRGFDVWELALEQALNLPAEPPVREDPIGVEPGALPPLPEVPTLQPQPYNAWRTLMPRAWAPIWENDALGTVLGLATTGEDPLSRHRWGVQLGYGLQSQDLNYTLAYQNRQLYPLLGVTTSRSIQAAPSVARIGGTNVFVPERAHGVDVSVAVPYSRQTWSVQLNATYSFEHRDRLIDFALAPDQQAPVLPPTGNFANLALSFTATRTRRTPGAISPEYGQRGSLTTVVRDYWLGSDYRQATVQLSGQHYQLMPWLLHHVLTLRLAAGGGFNELATRPLFAFGGLTLRDPIRDFIFGAIGGDSSLRGYGPAAMAGDFYYNGTLEYRAPLWRIDRGFSVLPFYLRTLAAAAFADFGGAGQTPAAVFTRFALGVGAELRLDLDYGFYYGATIRLGYARGVLNGGIHNVFLSLSNGF